MSEVQDMSPTLMEGYLRAASKISSVAVGDKTASPTEFTVKVPRTTSQMVHVEVRRTARVAACRCSTRSRPTVITASG
jgi:hypothetical protein